MINIVQGEDKDFVIRLTDGVTKDPVNLTNLTEATICILKTDRTKLAVVLTSATANGSQLSTLSVSLGKIQVSLTKEDTATLKPCSAADLEITLDLDGSRRKVIFPDSISIIQTRC
jgi:hypothetical protein